MSADGNRIICRKCQESISLDNESCPNCGTGIRRTLPYAVGLVLGVLLVGAGAVDIVSPDNKGLVIYGVLGLFVAASSGYMIYEKRQRIAEAASDAGSEMFEG